MSSWRATNESTAAAASPPLWPEARSNPSIQSPGSSAGGGRRTSSSTRPSGGVGGSTGGRGNSGSLRTSATAGPRPQTAMGAALMDNYYPDTTVGSVQSVSRVPTGPYSSKDVGSLRSTGSASLLPWDSARKDVGAYGSPPAGRAPLSPNQSGVSVDERTPLVEGGARARAPFEYRPVTNTAEGPDSHLSNMYHRYKYYSKLSTGGGRDSHRWLIPHHLVPPNLFVMRPGAKGTQSSLVTILSIWNTMAGSSLLAMPWAIHQAGFATGIVIVLAMMGICFFTCNLVIKSGKGGTLNGEDVEFADVCRHYLGDKAYVVAVIFSILTLLGASIIYWVLMSSFLYNIVDFIHDPHNTPASTGSGGGGTGSGNLTLFEGTLGALATNGTTGHSHWEHYWTPKMSAVFLVGLIFPLINFKSLTFFTKFNSVGVFSVAYMVIFVVVNAIRGEHSESSPVGGLHMEGAQMFGSNFFMLTGVLTLSYFIHNGSLSILRNQRRPENNSRDLFLAYVLVCLTYLFIGVVVYVSFKGDKGDIKQNFLQNFVKGDSNYIWALVAQIFLLFQMVTVYPLLQFIIRFQVFSTFFQGQVWPSVWHVLGLNLMLTACCVTVAVVYPQIGNIIRFTGAFCGLAYVFALPALVYMKVMELENRTSKAVKIVLWAVIVFGSLNVVAQFVPFMMPSSSHAHTHNNGTAPGLF